ncbi:MAG: Asp-tRNA(Asn)/Glu-tRNA(Gln) amidotransferase subunit GatA [Flavisolibacter sp.]
MTTCVQTVHHYLKSIEQNKHLNAFIEVYSNESLDRAAELDNQKQFGKLHGVVIGIKDNICYKGHPSSAGSKMLQNYISLYSATAINRLLVEGAIIIGRQNCDEFGMGSTNENSSYGPVLNPLNNEYVPGGSSGGSAASIKAGLCMASLGSDTGGSIRLPADFCGIVGLKPSYGLVSRHGLIAYGSSFDQIGVLASNVSDAAKILEVISGEDEYDSTAQQKPPISYQLKNTFKPMKLAYFPEWINHSSVDREIQDKLLNLINTLKDKGHDIRPVHFDLTEYIVPTYYILTTAEASSNLARFDGIRYGYKSSNSFKNLQAFYKNNRTEGFGKEVKRRIMLGTFVLSTGYYDAYFTKAQQVRRQLLKSTELIFNEFDLIVAPTSPTPAFKIGEKNKDPVAMYMADIFTVFANLTGVPAISLPFFKHSSNLPFGVQLMANRFNEVSLLDFSHQLMQQ